MSRDLPHSKPLVNSHDDREAWLKARETGIGASESACLLGLDPYQSAFTLFQRKTGQLPPLEDNEFMEWGRRLEDVVAEKFYDETQRPISPDGVLFQSLRWPALLATPDYRQLESKRQGLLEIKTGSFHAKDDWMTGVPLNYQCQVQHQMAVTGAPFASVAALLGGNDFRWHDVPRNETFIASLVRAVSIFWWRIQNDRPPPPDDSPSTSKTLSAMAEDGRAIDLPEAVLSWHEEMVKAAADEKAAKERKEEYRRKFEAVLGTATIGILPNDLGAYTFKSTTRKEYTVKAVTYRTLRHTKKVKL